VVGGGLRWWTVASAARQAEREQLQRRAFHRALFVLDTVAQQSLCSEPCAEIHAPMRDHISTKEQHQTECVDGVMSSEGTKIIMY
jgi:hypothetical protein